MTQGFSYTQRSHVDDYLLVTPGQTIKVCPVSRTALTQKRGKRRLASSKTNVRVDSGKRILDNMGGNRLMGHSHLDSLDKPSQFGDRPPYSALQRDNYGQFLSNNQNLRPTVSTGTTGQLKKAMDDREKLAERSSGLSKLAHSVESFQKGIEQSNIWTQAQRFQL